MSVTLSESPPLSKSEKRLRLELLSKLDLFNSFSTQALAQLAKKFRGRTLKKDEILFKEGDVERTMYVIFSGEIMIHKAGKSIAVRGSGEYIGEMALIESMPRAASAKAIADAVLLEISDHDFQDQLLSEP